MITTVTLSPCIDKTVTVKQFNTDRTNRIESSRLDAGGKGINVCLALSALDVDSRALYFDFDGGDIITSALEKAGAEAEQVKCAGRIRTNLKICDLSNEKTIELNEQNPTVTLKSVQKLMELIKLAAEDSEVIALCGSVPAGVPTDIYKQLTLAAKSVNPRIKIILDSEGEPFLEGLSASPYLVKPNLEELERTFGISLSSDADIIALAESVIKKYSLGVMLVSLGSDGAIAVTKDGAVRAKALKVARKSSTGAGDAMVAGACFAISKGLGVRDILRFGTCAAAGAVECEGTSFCTRERFEELFSKFE